MHGVVSLVARPLGGQPCKYILTHRPIRQLEVAPATVHRWKHRDSVQDTSSRPRRLWCAMPMIFCAEATDARIAPHETKKVFIRETITGIVTRFVELPTNLVIGVPLFGFRLSCWLCVGLCGVVSFHLFKGFLCLFVIFESADW